MTRLHCILFLSLLGLACPLDMALAEKNPPGSTDAQVSLEHVGFLSKALERVHAEQEAMIAEGICLSNVATVVRKGRVVYHRAVNSTVAGDRPITDRTLFPIWSMTKPITSVAAMLLYERGAFQLDDAVATIIPQLARLTVKAEDGDPVPIARPISYRHLLTHTAGFYGYDGSFHEEGTWKEVMELDSLAALIDLLEPKPLQHQPGERYTYGLSTAVLGRAVELLSGKTLAEFLQAEIFQPLGMTDTRFYLSASDRKRFQPLFVREGPGEFRPGTAMEDELHYDPESRLYLGGEGLVSSLADYARFCQMLVDRGRPILSEKTLELMLKDHLGDIPGYGESEAENSDRLGFGFSIRRAGTGEAGTPPGIFGWGGYHTTHFWVDPKHALYAIFMTRLYPFSAVTLTRFRRAVYAPLDAIQDR